MEQVHFSSHFFSLDGFVYSFMSRVFISKVFPSILMKMLERESIEFSAWPNSRPMNQEELIKACQGHSGLICASTDQIDSYFLRACSHLQVLSQFAAGYDNIDLHTARRLNIRVGNTPDAMSDATADVAFGLMIAVARKMFYMHRQIVNGDWGPFQPTANLGFQLKGKTLGIFGLGRIGYAMAQRCIGAYNMKVIYHNRGLNTEAETSIGAKLVSLDELLETSDILSVHATLNEQTKGIFNLGTFSKMKRDAIFINTSRGAIHDEKDLLEALKRRLIWGAGLDVTDPEPMRPDHPLLLLENVCVLPHIGSATIEARTDMAVMAAQNVIDFYNSGKVRYPVV